MTQAHSRALVRQFRPFPCVASSRPVSSAPETGEPTDPLSRLELARQDFVPDALDLSSGKRTFLTFHRFTVGMRAGMIPVVVEGRIVESGRQVELPARSSR